MARRRPRPRPPVRARPVTTVYRGSQNAPTDTKVWVVRDDALEKLRPVICESGDGQTLVYGSHVSFAFGYHGRDGEAGPWALAAAILADAMGLEALNSHPRKVPMIKGFRDRYVAPAHKDGIRDRPGDRPRLRRAPPDRRHALVTRSAANDAAPDLPVVGTQVAARARCQVLLPAIGSSGTPTAAPRPRCAARSRSWPAGGPAGVRCP